VRRGKGVSGQNQPQSAGKRRICPVVKRRGVSSLTLKQPQGVKGPEYFDKSTKRGDHLPPSFFWDKIREEGEE